MKAPHRPTFLKGFQASVRKCPGVSRAVDGAPRPDGARSERAGRSTQIADIVSFFATRPALACEPGGGGGGERGRRSRETWKNQCRKCLWPSEDHRDPRPIRGGDDVGVLHAAAGLRHGDDAVLRRELEAVGGTGRRRPRRGRSLSRDPRPFRRRSSRSRRATSDRRRRPRSDPRARGRWRST